MRIAQVAPLFESVPPRLYGGTERVVSVLCEELVARGHDVTLYASGDSVTSARLVPCRSRALRLSGPVADPVAPHFAMLERVLRDAASYDIIHFHTDYLHFPWSRHLPVPHVTTLHGRLDLPQLQPIYDLFPDEPLVSISNAQRAPLHDVRWEATIHHGLPRTVLTLDDGPGEYFAFLGRISPEKRVDRAIEIACRTGRRLRISAKVDPADRDYFERHIAPLLRLPFVDFIGETSESQKQAFLGGAAALLFPIDWPEPFGLVMIEALACGTPVVAMRNGSVPEIIEHGVTGFVVDSIDDAVAAARSVPALSRRRCRAAFETRFTVDRMGRDYVAVYRRLIDQFQKPARRPTGDQEWTRASTYASSTRSGRRPLGPMNEPVS